MTGVEVIHGDCLDVMPTLGAGTVDAIICDPPYPCINRSYGMMTEAAWHSMMRDVVAESRRVLKPHGSAVFILQPNSERVGRMRPWLFEFQAWTAREWNMIQDVHWWNHAAMPTVHCNRDRGLMRPSVKACVWLGDPDCYRDQDAILIPAAELTANDRRTGDDLKFSTSGHAIRRSRINGVSKERGGVTPFNLIPMPNTDPHGAGGFGHGGGTPEPLADWWVRYITKPGDVVLDPFSGSGTIPLAAYARDRVALGIEKEAEYVATARRRIAEEIASTPLLSALEAGA